MRGGGWAEERGESVGEGVEEEVTGGGRVDGLVEHSMTLAGRGVEEL
jgi:hypothetical protein